ncbi:YccF domain-containing protein [Vibrio hippocampi]|uniref:Inner membrane protein YccF n=1 Tax=Vibrio hippocampi TaxID=654686 RepID=A0ABN8DP94_9VIBR|nr:YccF domain-containing protein [Vibrio hippocampi]CAH0528888.1 Inner membrane protein YccF [Vibrio hippocampi]
MRTLGNIIWFVFGGVVMGLGWWLVSLIAFISIIGIPWGRACFTIGTFSFFPFGKEVVARNIVNGSRDIGTSPFGVIGNVLWFIFAGIWLAIGHVACALMFFVTIIGIPFGIQHFKLALISLAPIGKTIVERRDIEAAYGKNNLS